MKILRHISLFAFAILLGIAMGVAFRRAHRPTAPQNSAQPTLASAAFDNAAVTNAKKSAQSKRFDDSPLTSALERDLSMSEGVTRWLHWLEAIERAQLADFPRLAQLAGKDSIALQLLAARWIDLDPRHLFDVIASQPNNSEVWSSLARTLFDEWPKRDTRGVIDALSSTNALHALGDVRDWRRQVAGKLIETDPETGVKLFHEWNIENFGPRMKGVALWAAKDPRHAAEVALAHTAGYATQLVMEEIGKQWAQVNPADAMEFAATRRDQYGSILASSALKAWAEKDLDNAAQWLGSTDPSTRNRLSPPFVEAWGKNDPEAALDWCEGNLSGTTLAQAVGGLVKGAAENDVRSAAELVNSLKPSAARMEGAVAVAQKWMPEYSSRDPVKPELKEWLVQLDAESVRRVLDEVQWRWSENNPKDFAEFLKQLSPEQVSERSYAHVSRTFARSNPEEALTWANSLPESAALSAGQHAFSTWFESQPEPATQWLDSLPENDSRRAHFFETTVQTIVHYPFGPERLAALPERHREAARQIIEKLPLGQEHRAKALAAFASKQ